jgi:hypothetical protein
MMAAPDPDDCRVRSSKARLRLSGPSQGACYLRKQSTYAGKVGRGFDKAPTPIFRAIFPDPLYED